MTVFMIIQFAKEKNKPTNLLGLVSDGGVHSYINHLFALTGLFKKNK